MISNSVSIDYVVHHWPGMLHKHKLPFLQQMPFNYPFEEVNQTHATSQLHFSTTKTIFFTPFVGKRGNQKYREKRGNLDQMVQLRLSSKHGVPVSEPP